MLFVLWKWDNMEYIILFCIIFGLIVSGFGSFFLGLKIINEDNEKELIFMALLCAIFVSGFVVFSALLIDYTEDTPEFLNTTVEMNP